MLDSRLLRAEWLKLRSVPWWVVGLLTAAVVTVTMSMLIASGSGASDDDDPVTTNADGEPVRDDFHFVHQPMSGDGSVTARVLDQTAIDSNGNPTTPQDAAMAGVMIKESTTAGSPYAAVAVTPGDGVRIQANFDADIAGSSDASPRWLRLTRSGSSITGYESADGRKWTQIGSVDLDELPETVEVGFFVASPPEVEVVRQAGSTAVGEMSTLGVARFDNVGLDTGKPQGAWSSNDIGEGWSRQPAAEKDHVFEVSGSGEIAANPPDDDVVQISLLGVLVGSLAIIAVSVLFVTSEYRRDMIRTTFAAAPRRNQVLVAKSLVAGAVTFLIGLAASVTAFFLAVPVLQDNGFAPPRFPDPSITDPSVVRAIVGSAGMVAVVAVLSVAVGMILRRGAPAIAAVTGLFFVPAFLATVLPPTPSEWLVRLTPASGLAIQRSLAPTRALIEPWAMIPPWIGFGVLCLYAGGALVAATWLLRRRDA
jgi:hypothetical protein